jgi:hypothetical protein
VIDGTAVAELESGQAFIMTVFVQPWRALVRGLLLMSATLSVSTPTRAQARDDGGDRVEWRDEWPRFRLSEYLVTGLSLAGLGAIVFFAGRPEQSPEYRNFFDVSVRNAVRAETRAGRDHARRVGDVGFRFLNFYPYVDSLVVAGLVHGSSDVALQTALIDTEAFAIAGFVSIGFERLIGRARPSARECETNAEYEAFCGDADRYSSLLSGHTAIAFAGAGLTCAHHTNLPLYGARAADLTACVAAAGIALSSGVSRAVNDRHWASDLVLAAGLGTLTGYFLPVWLHYDGTRASRARDFRPDEVRWTLLPELGPEQASVRLVVVQ